MANSQRFSRDTHPKNWATWRRRWPNLSPHPPPKFRRYRNLLEFRPRPARRRPLAPYSEGDAPSSHRPLVRGIDESRPAHRRVVIGDIAGVFVDSDGASHVSRVGQPRLSYARREARLNSRFYTRGRLVRRFAANFPLPRSRIRASIATRNFAI